jgi:hypothetical protein
MWYSIALEETPFGIFLGAGPSTPIWSELIHDLNHTPVEVALTLKVAHRINCVAAFDRDVYQH